MFAHLPKSEKYIFQGREPGSIKDEKPSGKNIKTSKYNFAHKLLDQKPHVTSGGEVRIADSKNFPLSKTIAAAHVTIQPGALREMHWHPNADEWSFFIGGRARVTVFGSEGAARTFDYQPGDVGIVSTALSSFLSQSDDSTVLLTPFRTGAPQHGPLC